MEFGSYEERQDVKMNLSERIGKYLQQNSGKKLTAGDLVQWFKVTYRPAYEEKRQATNKKTDEELDLQIGAEIRSCYYHGYLNNYGIQRTEEVNEGKSTLYYYYSGVDGNHNFSTSEAPNYVDTKQEDRGEAIRLTERLTIYLKENPGKRCTARELAVWFMQKFPQACEAKKRRSRAQKTPIDSDAALETQIVSEIGAHRKALEKNGILVTSERPRRYYYEEGENSSGETIAYAEPASTPHAVESFGVADKDQIHLQEKTRPSSEEDLYMPALEFIRTERGVLGKRIHEGRSSNRRGPGGNRWLYPDLVGMEDLSSNWNRGVRDYVFETEEKKVKLWSLEVKVEINRSDVREYFFQAVSNSSWANVGYLAAWDIKDSALDELRILSGLHGIGFIQLNYDEPSESQIIIPAQERADVDWSTASRIADENTDFRNYINAVKVYRRMGGDGINWSDWDTPEIEDD